MEGIDKRIDKHVNFLTDRLEIDRELQMDIKNEMRSHLEEKIDENIASGMGEEESVDKAIKQFGPREELAEKIWRANIGRMRMHSVIKWVLRLTLVPAAIAFTIFHGISQLLSPVAFPLPCRRGTPRLRAPER